MPRGSLAARSHGRRRRNRPPPSRSMGCPTASSPFAIGRSDRSADVWPKRSEISCCGIGLLVDEQPFVVLASSSCHPFVSSFGNSLLLSSFSTLLIAKHCALPTKSSRFPAKRRLSRAFAPFLFVQSQAGQLGLGGRDPALGGQEYPNVHCHNDGDYHSLRTNTHPIGPGGLTDERVASSRVRTCRRTDIADPLRVRCRGIHRLPSSGRVLLDRGSPF